jgi:hypothetical protein
VKPIDQPPTPAMSSADTAAHNAASHVRPTAPLPTAALAALARLERALRPAVTS